MQNLNRLIHPTDPMLAAPRGEARIEQYFRIGASGLQCIKNSVQLAGLDKVEAVLDLPCGFGRIGRFIRAWYPEAEITFCDLNREMVDFCCENFDGVPLCSKEDLTAVEFERKYDVIWIGSLFTHIDAYRTEVWLKHLLNALRPNGVLVATFHGAWAFEFSKKFPMCAPAEWDEIVSGYNLFGYGYAPYRSRGISSVGISLSKPSTVLRMVEEIAGTRIVLFSERGFANNHDLLAIQNKDRLAGGHGWDRERGIPLGR